MRHRDRRKRLALVFLALALNPGTIFAQGHLAALRDWMYHTQQAARYIEAGEYVSAEERIKVAINDIKPYLPDTRRIMARTYCELARVLYLERRYAEAEPLARSALSVRRRSPRQTRVRFSVRLHFGTDPPRPETSRRRPSNCSNVRSLCRNKTWVPAISTAS